MLVLITKTTSRYKFPLSYRSKQTRASFHDDGLPLRQVHSNNNIRKLSPNPLNYENLMYCL